MKDHVESSYLATFDAFRVNRDQVRDLILGQRPLKPAKICDFHLSFFENSGRRMTKFYIC